MSAVGCITGLLGARVVINQVLEIPFVKAAGPLRVNSSCFRDVVARRVGLGVAFCLLAIYLLFPKVQLQIDGGS